MAEQPPAKLYVILGSHACRAGMLMLEHKGIPYRTVTLPTGLHSLLVGLSGFHGDPVPRRLGDRRPWTLALADWMGTVPALQLGEHRVQTNREIARLLEQVHPQSPLFPADPDRRAAVEEAERWGDEVLQMAARRLGICAVLHGRDWISDRGNDGRLGPILWRNETARFVGMRMLGRFAFGANPEAEAELLESVPGLLDKVDAWIGAGVLNGAELSAADFMIAPSVALLTHRPDLRPEVERRPVANLIDRLLPQPRPEP